MHKQGHHSKQTASRLEVPKNHVVVKINNATKAKRNEKNDQAATQSSILANIRTPPPRKYGKVYNNVYGKKGTHSI